MKEIQGEWFMTVVGQCVLSCVDVVRKSWEDEELKMMQNIKPLLVLVEWRCNYRKTCVLFVVECGVTHQRMGWVIEVVEDLTIMFQ